MPIAQRCSWVACPRAGPRNSLAAHHSLDKRNHVTGLSDHYLCDLNFYAMLMPMSVPAHQAGNDRGRTNVVDASRDLLPRSRDDHTRFSCSWRNGGTQKDVVAHRPHSAAQIPSYVLPFLNDFFAVIAASITTASGTARMEHHLLATCEAPTVIASTEYPGTASVTIARKYLPRWSHG